MKVKTRDTAFAHPTERFVAETFDRFGFEWEYEEHDFLLVNYEGSNTRHFCPDFFLPEFGETGLFLEVTTIKSNSRRGKNRKIRKFRRQCPDVPIVLVDRETIMGMCARFGRNFESMLKREQLPEYKNSMKAAA